MDEINSKDAAGYLLAIGGNNVFVSFDTLKDIAALITKLDQWQKDAMVTIDSLRIQNARWRAGYVGCQDSDGCAFPETPEKCKSECMQAIHYQPREPAALKALHNCRLLAARRVSHKGNIDPDWHHILRFCKEGGSEGSILREPQDG